MALLLVIATYVPSRNAKACSVITRRISQTPDAPAAGPTPNVIGDSVTQYEFDLVGNRLAKKTWLGLSTAGSPYGKSKGSGLVLAAGR